MDPATLHAGNDEREAKRRRRRALAALLRFRRLLRRLCKAFASGQGSVEGWQERVEVYATALFEAYPDVITEESRARIYQAIGLAGQVEDGLHNACDLVTGEVSDLIDRLDEEFGVQAQIKRWLQPLWAPFAALINATPLTKALAALAVFAVTGGILYTTQLSDEASGDVLRDPDNVTSVSHSVNVASANGTIVVTWQAEPSAAGYSVMWSANPVDLPDESVDLAGEVTSTASGPLAPGTWFFHLRTRNRAGRWTSTVHLGPFLIQPSAPVQVSGPVPTLPPVLPTTAPAATPAPGVAGAATPTPNRAPVVSPISAQFSQAQQTTVYRVTATDPEGAALTLTWSGTNCGTTSRPDDRSFSWRHPHTQGDPGSCAPNTEHADVTITLRVSDGVNSVVCTYQGASNGTGPPCR